MFAIEEIIVFPPAVDEIVDPMAWFDSPGPFELEIGCGKGGFLLHRARANPHIRILGIEWANKFYRYAADRMARWELTNVRVMRTEARQFVLRNLPAACVSVLHLYHPDPWPKRKHHKRRLVDATFVEAVARVLVPGGRWLIQTDHLEYFDVIVRLVSDHPLLVEPSWEEADAVFAEEWPGTNFEIKYSREGRSIYRVAYEKRQRDEVSVAPTLGVNRSEILAE